MLLSLDLHRSLGMQGLSVMNELDPMPGSNNQLNPVNSQDYHLHHNFYNTTNNNGSNNVITLNTDNFFVEHLQNLPCNKLSGLSKGQQQLCQLYKDHIPFVGRGARDSISECQFQLKNARWNCSTFDDNSVFGPILKSGRYWIASLLLRCTFCSSPSSQSSFMTRLIFFCYSSLSVSVVNFLCPFRWHKSSSFPLKAIYENIPSSSSFLEIYFHVCLSFLGWMRHSWGSCLVLSL